MKVYIAATNRMSWGRGTKPWAAIGHAIEHGGIEVDEVQLFEVRCPEGTSEDQVYVNDMGQITAPTGSEVKEVTLNYENADKFWQWLGLVNVWMKT